MNGRSSSPPSPESAGLVRVGYSSQVWIPIAPLRKKPATPAPSLDFRSLIT